jgi:transcriptional regulator with XRE-family HTH domain
MIGKYLNYLRLKEGLNIEQVSEKSGIDATVIHEFEATNIVRIPNTDLVSLAKAFTFKTGIDYFNFLQLNGATRRFRVYALGLPKTGTVSLKGIFDNYRSGHEFWQWDMNQNYIAYENKTISREGFRDFLLLRDAAACLEMDSAYCNRYAIELFAETFSDARFICLFRDPVSWVRSQVNYFMDTSKEALQSLQIENGFPFDLPRGDKLSREKFLRQLDKNIEVTFQCWANSYRSILQQLKTLDSSRYCFIPTHTISQNMGLLASFAGVPESSLIAEKSHLNKSDYQTDVLKLVDVEIIKGYYQTHCKEIEEEISEKL